MQNIQDLKEKIFFESKNMIAILDKISNVDELLSKQDLVDDLANRISFLRLLEKNIAYFGNENFSSTDENNENFSSIPDQNIKIEIEEEEAIFNNQLNEIGEKEEFSDQVTEEEAIFNNQLNEIVEGELHETLVNFVEENPETEITDHQNISPAGNVEDVFNEQMKEVDEHEISGQTDDTLNFVDEERILADSEPDHEADIDEKMFSDEQTEEEAIFNNQLNEIDGFENEVSDHQGDVNDFEEEEKIRNNFETEAKNEENQEINEIIPSIFDTELLEDELLIEENEEHFTVSGAMVENGELPTDTSNVEGILTEIKYEAAVEEKQEQNILAEINDRRKIVDIDRPVHENEKDKPASDESFENLEAYQQEKKIKLAHIKGLKAVQTLFDDDHLERILPTEKTESAEKKESGSILKTNIPTDFMEAEKKKPEFKLDLNDRIAFSKTLFGGSQSELNEVVNNLNSFRTLEEAKEYLSDLYYSKKWNKVDEYAQRLWILVENKFL
ncbi:hypothetical protein SAMN05421856_110105 [Chryseobacterium taichungense]|uniref:Uncharacterized protein n=1 Tax=Chryseobacterium taichungense TaxID=295069 RepID=A0A1H8CTI4_9FLAO|nr:hypothetical protein [Chryseobacterium taichungense]SEM98189.1 hypothetical protein SAMN05421856_110105 [Chryseobacterium taichungense]